MNTPSSGNDPQSAALPFHLVWLQRMVWVLTLVMILGLITVVSVFVTRFPKPAQNEIALPTDLTLPEGITATAVTFGDGWIAVVDQGAQIIVFDATTMAEIGRLEITNAQ
jgi:hypothetical protein